MAFREKSAWWMLFALILTGSLFYYSAFSALVHGQNISVNAKLFIGFTISLAVLAVIGHITIAVMSPKDANANLDEREKLILARAGNISGNILGGGLIMSILTYLVHNNGDILFFFVFGSLLGAQMLEYILQIYFYRKSIV